MKKDCCTSTKTIEIFFQFHLLYPSFKFNIKYDIPYEIVQALRNVTNLQRFRNISSKESSSTSSFFLFFASTTSSLCPRLTFAAKNNKKT